MASDVTELIAALRGGGMSLAEVAQQFRERSWPRAQEPDPQTYLELAAAAQRDPRPDVPGSFDDVVAAYDRGELTHTQYRTLADAAAEGMHREDMRKGLRTND
jgi:hypothetical protein